MMLFMELQAFNVYLDAESLGPKFEGNLTYPYSDFSQFISDFDLVSESKFRLFFKANKDFYYNCSEILRVSGRELSFKPYYNDSDMFVMNINEDCQWIIEDGARLLFNKVRIVGNSAGFLINITDARVVFIICEFFFNKNFNSIFLFEINHFSQLMLINTSFSGFLQRNLQENPLIILKNSSCLLIWQAFFSFSQGNTSLFSIDNTSKFLAYKFELFKSSFLNISSGIIDCSGLFFLRNSTFISLNLVESHLLNLLGNSYLKNVGFFFINSSANCSKGLISLKISQDYSINLLK